ncbi:ANTAR domain-containing response regulator [Roseibium sp.]|uniref:ANTAR domain-containing response regulator n=1 Tax=Roseibium sp. TaxID=1936156 RepID=UPI0035141AB4
MREPSLRILIFDEDIVRASVLEEGLKEPGCGDVEVLVVTAPTGLAARIAEFDPDVIFMDLQNPNRDSFENMLAVSKAVARPIAVFVDEADAGTIDQAVEAGVSAYIVDGLKKERVKSILDVTISRFNAVTKLRRELEETRAELADRKTIDQAKRLLMKRRKLTEEQAYALMRKTAMSKSCRIVEVAQSMIVVADLLGEENP